MNTLYSIDNIIKDICIKDNQDQNTIFKWKSPEHQVVIGTNRYFYKIYEYLDVKTFESIVRYKLADYYHRKYDFKWEINTITNDINDYKYDIERRSILDSITYDTSSNTEYVINASKDIFIELSRSLELDSILLQAKSYDEEFNRVKSIRLVRFAYPKPNDYAIYKDNVILLDDADFSLVLINESNTLESIPSNIIPISTTYGDFYLIPKNYPQNLIKGDISGIGGYKSSEYEWVLYKPSKEDKSINNINSIILDTHAKQILHTINNLYGDENMISSDKDNDFLLYHNNVGRKSFQWELWTACNNLCTFCYLGKENRGTDPERQLRSIEDLNKEIDNLDFNVYNNISLIGGDFFQGQLHDPRVRNAFFALMIRIFKLYQDKKIGSIWMTVTLTKGDQKDLYEVLDLADSMKIYPKSEYGASGLWLCTSWDTKGRFHTPESKENWKYHMHNIHNKYVWVKFNTTLILTEDFCKDYNLGNFRFNKFSKEFNTSLFFKQCGVPEVSFQGHDRDSKEDLLNWWLSVKQELNKKFNLDFFPKRKTFCEFLQKCYHEEPEYYERLFNIVFRADELHRNINADEHDTKLARDKTSTQEEADVPTGTCSAKHIIYYYCYSDSATGCCLCDKKAIEDL